MEIHACQHSARHIPEAAEFQMLERKIADMEDRMSFQEHDYRMRMDQTRRSYEMQLLSMRQQSESVLHSKTLEVERFRGEVSSLLKAAKGLRVSGTWDSVG